MIDLAPQPKPMNPFIATHQPCEPEQQRPSVAPLASPRRCPFCDQVSGTRKCEHCQRDVTARRQVCTCCRKATPASEAACCRCGARRRSDLWWKLPLIGLLFFAVFALNVIIALS